MTTDLPAVTPARTSWRSLPPLALVPIAGFVWWVMGFLPWLLDGLGQDVFRGDILGPLAVPLLTGSISALVLGAGLGGVLAGLVVWLGAGSRAQRAGACGTGVAIVLLITLIQSRSGVSGIGVDERITNGLTVVVILTTLVGLGLGLVSMSGPVGLGFALAAVAGAAPGWVIGVLNAIGVGYGPQLRDAQEIARWLGAAVLVAALVSVGWRPVVRAVAWPGVVLLAWIIGPTVTAAGYLQVYLRPGMGWPQMWGDQLAGVVDVWRLAASPQLRPLTSWLVAIGVAGAVALWLARRPSPAPDHPAQ